MMKLNCFFIAAIAVVNFHCSPQPSKFENEFSQKNAESISAAKYLTAVNELFGFPSTVNTSKEGEANLVAINHDYYLGIIDCETKSAKWISHVVQPINSDQESDYDRDFSFTPDPILPDDCQTSSQDYTHSGYDRGHLAAAKDFASYGKEAIKSSFFTSNVLPQVGSGFNRDLWKNLEEQIRQWSQKYGRLFVYTGPIMANLPEENLPRTESGIPVPKAFYKIVVRMNDGENIEALGFIIENLDHRTHEYGDNKINPRCIDNLQNTENRNGTRCPTDNLTNIERHITPIEEIEKAAKIKFFTHLADAKPIKLRELKSTIW